MALDWTDGGVLATAATTIGGGIIAFVRWVKPLIENAFLVIPELKKISEENSRANSEIATSMVSMSQAITEQSESYKVLARLMSQSHIAGLRSRNVLLLVEDSKVDAKVIETISLEYVRRFRLHFVCVTTLDEAITQVTNACLVILDIMLENITDKSVQLKSFVEMCPSPVIVNSGTAYAVGDFPNAFAVIWKQDERYASKLRDAIEAAVLGHPLTV